MQCNVMNVMLCNVVLCNVTVWYVWYGMVWYGMVWYGKDGMVWYATFWYVMDVSMYVCMYVHIYLPTDMYSSMSWRVLQLDWRNFTNHMDISTCARYNLRISLQILAWSNH